MGTQKFVLSVNNRDYEVVVEAGVTLLYVLRNSLGLKGTKFGCGLEQCYACAVLVDGEVATSCATDAIAFAGKHITTIEGLGSPGRLHPVQQAFIEEQAAQCGYCTPGIVISAKALLDRVPHPSDQQIQAALKPHLCRCGSQPRVIRAVRRAAGS